MVIDPVAVADRKIGPGEPLFFIAEIGLNHNQDLDIAKRLVDVAARAGCSAAKFQTFRTHDVYVERSRAGVYSLMGREIPIFDLHKSLEMPPEWIAELQTYCEDRGLVFFSAPIGKEALDLLDQADCPVFKISSYELTNIPFLREVAKRGRPVIVSTGAASLGEIERSVALFCEYDCPFVLMQCLTKYPAPLNSANLAAMDTLTRAFGVPTGFSDNGFVTEAGEIDTMTIPQAAAMAGADLFEIHITLDRSMPGPDQGFATEPDELCAMVARMNEIRARYNAGERFAIDSSLLGSGKKETLPEERYVREFAYKCLFSTRDIAAGETLSAENIRALRPGEAPRGIEPHCYELLVDQAVARRPLGAWEPITWSWLLS